MEKRLTADRLLIDNMSLLPFEIKTLDYNASARDLEPGDEVHLEHVEGQNFHDRKIYTTDGVVLANHGNFCSVKFETKFGTEEVANFEKEDIFSKNKPVRVKYISEYPKYNCVIVSLSNKCSHLIDLDNPGVIKYEFSTILIEGSGKRLMISPIHLLHIPIYNGDFGKGCIIDMSNEASNVVLKPSKETQKFVKNCKLSSMTVTHVINGNHLYITNGRRIIVYDITSGDEIWAWNINLDKDDYWDPSISVLNNRVFMTTKREFWELPTRFDLQPIIIQIPQPQRQIYTKDKFFISGAYYDDIQINPRKELLIEISYCDEFKDVKYKIFSDDEIVDLLETFEKININSFANVVNKLITTKLSEFRKKYPSLKITFRHKDIKSIVLSTDFQSVIDGRVKITVPRYISENPVFEHKVWIGEDHSKCLGGLRFVPRTGEICKIDESGCMHGDGLIRKIFPKERYYELTKEMVIKQMLGQTLIKMIREISVKIKYEDINDLPLSFDEFFTFDGDSFTRKDYSKIILNNGEVLDFQYINLRESISVKVKNSSDYIDISIDGNEIPDWGYLYPQTKVKSNYYIENITMPYHKTIKLENIKGPGKHDTGLPSELDIIRYACNKISEESRYDKQRVNFFIWKEDAFTIKIPLSFSPEQGLQTGHGVWCNNCYIVYDSEYVRFVRITI